MTIKYTKMPELKDVVTLLKKSPEYNGKLNHINEERVMYASYSKKNSKTKAKIGPIPQRFAIFIEDYDYLLEINQESWLSSSESERLYTVLHELLHVPAEGFDKESKHYKKTNPHDLQDFKELVTRFGVEQEVDKVMADSVIG